MIELKQVQAALALDLSDDKVQEIRKKMVPQIRLLQQASSDNKPRLAATLILLYPFENRLHFVLTRRPDHLPDHAGQVSLPGGRQEPNETFAQTALRETCEEVGVCETSIKILGNLTKIYIPPSNFLVYPFVGYIHHHPIWKHNIIEVAEVIECPLELLLDDNAKGYDLWRYNGIEYEHGWYEVNGHRVWGATAIMLSEFEWRLRLSLPDSN